MSTHVKRKECPLTIYSIYDMWKDHYNKMEYTKIKFFLYAPGIRQHNMCEPQFQVERNEKQKRYIMGMVVSTSPTCWCYRSDRSSSNATVVIEGEEWDQGCLPWISVV